MKWLKFVRTFKEGVSNFLRNGSLTFVTVVVLSLSLYAISATLMYLYMAYGAMAVAQDKVNVNIYFKPTVEEVKILEAQSKLEQYDGVKYVRYKSKEEAFEELKAMAEKDETIKKALEEIDWENPLDSFLIVGAQSHDQFEKIMEQVNSSFFNEDIDYTNFQQNREQINRVNSTINTTKKAGLMMGAVFVILGIMITFNTIKLTIYSHKQEFEVMRLVGASNLYIRMPFIFEGIFYGLVSGVVVMILLALTAYFVVPLSDANIPEGNTMKIYLGNFLLIFTGVMGSGILLGMISSFIAIRKYLKI